MKICMIGSGYVGLVSGACFADLGNTVYCVDNNMEKMPYSTRLYFLKVQEIMSSEMDKSLV